MNNVSEFIQVITTTASKADAERFAQHLVAEELAACVQIIGPMISTYRWQGAIQTDEEWLCQIKTARALYPQVEAAILDQHAYETPEILAVPVVAGSEAYLAWLAGALKPASPSQ